MVTYPLISVIHSKLASKHSKQLTNLALLHIQCRIHKIRNCSNSRLRSCSYHRSTVNLACLQITNVPILVTLYRWASCAAFAIKSANIMWSDDRMWLAVTFGHFYCSRCNFLRKQPGWLVSTAWILSVFKPNQLTRCRRSKSKAGSCFR